MSTRKGVYVVSSSQGAETVHVVYGQDLVGISMDVNTYRREGIWPPVEELPDVKAYHASIASTKVKYNDWQKLKGKRLRVSVGPDTFEGTLMGLDGDSMVAVSAGEIAKPWLIEGNGSHFSFHPNSPGVKVQILPD